MSTEAKSAPSAEESRTRAAPQALPVYLFEHLLGSLDAIVCVFDAVSARLVYVSPQIERILGYSPEAVLAEPDVLARSLHRADRDKVMGALSTLLREKIDQREELRMFSSDGRYIDMDGLVTVVREDGLARYVLAVLIDISARKALEEQLRESHRSLEERVRERTAQLEQQADELRDANARLEQALEERARLDADRRASEARFEAFAESASEAILTANEAGIIASVNPQAEALFGHSAGELVGRPITILMPERFHDEYLRGFARYIATGQSPVVGRTVELTAIGAGGEEVPVELSLSSWRASDGRPHFIALLRDIRERKRAEAALRRTNEELERARSEAVAANRAKSEFLANMSHDIRTPMNGVLGMTDLLLYTDLSPAQHEYVDLVRRSAESLLHLLNDILDFSKIEAGKLELELAPFQIHDSIGDTLQPLAVQAAEKGVELAYHVSPSIPEVLVGDAGRLRQILVNLVGNAIKFTPRGVITVDVNASDRDTRSIELSICVRDTGIGIDDADRTRIFEAFQQVTRTHEGRSGGTGLGLTIAARLAGMMGGRIWVESEIGQGSTFCFTARFGIGEPLVSSSLHRALQGARVLIAAENETNRLMLKETLARWSMATQEAIDESAILAELTRAEQEDRAFGLLLLDTTLGPQSGIDIARDVRATKHGLPIVMLWAAGERPSKSEMAMLGIADVVQKPVRQSNLLETVAAVLTSSAPAPEAPVRAGRTVEPMRVLVVDDNAINRRINAELLRKRGHEVEVAENGREALDAIARSHFDCVLMDVEMPVMDGLTATRSVRAREAKQGGHVPIIAMTAYAMKGDRERCLEAGMDGYVSKPARAIELFAAIEARGRTIEQTPAVEARTESKSVRSLDVDEALERAGGSHDLLVELAELFLEQSPTMRDEIRSAIEAKDTVALRRSAHTLKGSVALFGAKRAFALAQRLEELGREGTLEGAEEARAALDEAVVRLGEEIAQFLTEGPKEE